VTDLTANGTPRPLPAHGVSFGEALRVWLRVAALSFGGPAGQIAVMHRIIVDEKKWVGESRFLHALSYCMLLPGPEAQQLATYIGWLMHRWPGAIAAGGLFVVPGIVSIMVLSWVYALYGQVPIVAALFFGLKAAVLAIVLFAVYRVGSRALKSGAMIAVAALAFVAIFFSHVPFPLIVLAAGVIGFVGARAGSAAFVVGGGHGPSGAAAAGESRLGEDLPEHARPTIGRALRVSAIWLVLWLGPVIAILATLGLGHTFSDIGLFFSKMAVVTFGGAYAVLAYMAQQAVEHYGWLRPGEMLDGLGMAETTPGPLIMVVQFVGFMAAYRDPGSLPPLLAGTLGGLLATSEPKGQSERQRDGRDDTGEQDIDQRRGDADLRCRGDDAEAEHRGICERRERTGVLHAGALGGTGDEIACHAGEPRERAEDEQCDQQVRDEGDDLAQHRTHGGDPDRVRGHDDEDQPHVPGDDAAHESCGVQFHTRALQERADARLRGELVETDLAEQSRDESPNDAGDDPAKYKQHERADDRRDGYEEGSDECVHGQHL